MAGRGGFTGTDEGVGAGKEVDEDAFGDRMMSSIADKAAASASEGGGLRLAWATLVVESDLVKRDGLKETLFCSRVSIMSFRKGGTWAADWRPRMTVLL